VNSSEKAGTKFYNEEEVKEMLDDISEAAEKAIEQAAAEAAKAAVIASIQREAAALAEAQRWHTEYGDVKKARVRTAVIAGVVCFLGGFAAGAFFK
jgi:cell division septum initiation protein DivIVA